MKEVITSDKNSKIKYLKKLYKTSQRKKEGVFILEGFRLIEQALKNGAFAQQIYMTPDFYNSSEGNQIKELIDNRVSNYLIDSSIIGQIADTVNPQGIIAIVNKMHYSYQEFINKASKVLVLDQIQDPGNMGTLIRTAVAAGIEGIIVLKGSVDIYNLKVLRATMGAIFSIPLINKMEIDDFIDFKKEEFNNYQLICSAIKGSKQYNNVDYDDSFMLVIGNEARGIRDILLEKADLKVKIPIRGGVESLNAAMAGGILLYHIINNVQ